MKKGYYYTVKYGSKLQQGGCNGTFKIFAIENENLEWVSNQENSIHSYSVLKREGGMKGKLNIARSKKINQFNINGSFIKEYPSAKEASRQLNISHEGICCCARGITKSSGGFLWAYI